MLNCPNCNEILRDRFEVRAGFCPSCRPSIPKVKDGIHEKAAKHAKSLPPRPGDIILTTETFVSGDAVRLGIVAAEVVLGMNALKDVAAGFRDVFGGRSGTAENSFKKARVSAMDDIRSEAAALRATHVVGVDINYHTISTGSSTNMMIVAVTGTAVRLPSGASN